MLPVTEIPVDLIDIDGNPRRDPGDLDELAASIRTRGVLQPIRVRVTGKRYHLIYGQRRLLASKLAGVATIPATVAEGDQDNDLVDAILENIQRQDLNSIDQARAIERLIETGLDEKSVAVRLARSTAWVNHHRRALRSDPYVVESVASGLLSFWAAVKLAPLPHNQQRALAKRAVAGQWTAHQLDVALRPVRPPSSRAPLAPAVDAAPAAERHVDGLAALTPRTPEPLARLLLWALLEMDALVGGRFEKRHPMGYTGENRAWLLVSHLPPETLSAELAQVLAEIIAEYGQQAVHAAVPRKGAA